MEPAASDGLKEHCLQATASLAGKPESECSFPELLGSFLAAKMPGTQRDALSALQLVREKQPGLDGRLARVPALVSGLSSAAASTDSQVAAAAKEAMAALQAAS